MRENRTPVLFQHDVVAQGQPEPGTFTRGLCCEERVKDLFPDIRRFTHPIVADADLDLLAKVSRQKGLVRREVMPSREPYFLHCQ